MVEGSHHDREVDDVEVRHPLHLFETRFGCGPFAEPTGVGESSSVVR
jgi:hypothetical protein